jgi:hypothetical protein
MLIASIQGCWRVSKRYIWQQGAASWLTPLGSIPSAKKEDAHAKRWRLPRASAAA